VFAQRLLTNCLSCVLLDSSVTSLARSYITYLMRHIDFLTCTERHANQVMRESSAGLIVDDRLQLVGRRLQIDMRRLGRGHDVDRTCKRKMCLGERKVTLLMRRPFGMTLPAAFCLSFSDCSILRSFSSTYHSLWRSSQDLRRRSAAFQALPAVMQQSSSTHVTNQVIIIAPCV